VPAPERHAGLVSRLSALTVDVVILTVVGLAVSTLPSVAWEQLTGTAPGWVNGVSAVVAAVLPFLYFTLSWATTGQTPGDILLGLVVRHRDGGRVGLLQAGLRAFGGLLLPPLWLVGMLAVLWNPERRAWHDRLFRTVVCYVPPRHPASVGTAGSAGSVRSQGTDRPGAA
jgi:uncharacterized RDD family membrane protein YckC